MRGKRFKPRQNFTSTHLSQFGKLGKKGGYFLITYYAYPKCTTCRKAKKWLDEQGTVYNEVNIAEAPPSKEKLSEMYKVSGVELKKFFNTSGMKYRELGLKDKLPQMTEEQQLELLASDGMLIKRPLTYGDGKVTLGFKEQDFVANWQ